METKNSEGSPYISNNINEGNSTPRRKRQRTSTKSQSCIVVGKSKNNENTRILKRNTALLTKDNQDKKESSPKDIWDTSSIDKVLEQKEKEKFSQPIFSENKRFKKKSESPIELKRKKLKEQEDVLEELFNFKLKEIENKNQATPSKKENSVHSKPTSNKNQNNSEGLIRLNKLLSNAGICARRKADELILSGQITVNGEVVSTLGRQVSKNDKVCYKGQIVHAEKKIYLLLNKPINYITTSEDPQGRKTVMDLVSKACKEKIYPVGRLDRNTSGLLLFTNDGEVASKLMHPSYNKKKIYQVSLDKPVTPEHMQQIEDGIELEDGEIHADALNYINEENLAEVGIEIHSGRNRIIRRIFEHLGYKVCRLDRVYYAGLTKKDLPRKRWRYLTEREIQNLLSDQYE